MNRSRRIRRVAVASVVIAMTTFTALSFVGSATASSGVPADRGGAASPDRWTRSVCSDVATWIDARAGLEGRVEKVLARAAADELTARQAGRQLAQAYSQGLEAGKRFVEDVKSAGAPKIEGGRGLAARYGDTIDQYRGAYAEAARSLAAVDLRDGTQVVAAVQAIDTKLRADLDVVGVDPIEDLRPIAALTTPIAASCHAVDAHLASTIDPACSAALDATQLVVDAENRYQAARSARRRRRQPTTSSTSGSSSCVLRWVRVRSPASCQFPAGPSSSRHKACWPPRTPST